MGRIIVPATQRRTLQQQTIAVPVTMAVQQRTARRRRNRNANNRNRLLPLPQSSMIPIALGNTYRASDESVVHRRREYVGEVSSSDPFTTNSYPINPGMSDLFPWLSSIATGFEEYEIRAMRFEFVPKSATTTTGSVMLAVDYDAADSPPATKSAMLTQAAAASTNAWKGIVMPLLNRSNAYLKHFLRFGNLAANLDIKTYDVGNLVVAVQGTGTTTGSLGELWVDYDVVLMTPQSATGSLAFANSAKIASTSTSAASPFNNSIITGGLAVRASGRDIDFSKVGEYILEYDVKGTTVSITSWAGSNGAVVTALNGTVASSGATGAVLITIPVANGRATFTFTAATLTSTTLRISPYPTTALN